MNSDRTNAGRKNTPAFNIIFRFHFVRVDGSIEIIFLLADFVLRYNACGRVQSSALNRSPIFLIRRC